jgi:hypothetical protein
MSRPLPLDLVTLIASSLSAYDVLHMSAVCRAWSKLLLDSAVVEKVYASPCRLLAELFSDTCEESFRFEDNCFDDYNGVLTQRDKSIGQQTGRRENVMKRMKHVLSTKVFLAVFAGTYYGRGRWRDASNEWSQSCDAWFRCDSLGNFLTFLHCNFSRYLLFLIFLFLADFVNFFLFIQFFSHS